MTGRIDVHFHAIPDFFREAVLAAGLGPAISTGFPAWSVDDSLGVMDANGIATAITSISQPGPHLGDDRNARVLARRCNEFAAEMVERHAGRFGAFAAVPLPDIEGAKAEIAWALDVLELDGIGLFASYSERFLGDPYFDPVLDVLNERAAVAFVHPNFHPSSRALKLDIPAFAVEFTFDTTRAAVNLILSGALDRFPRIRFILAHAGGTLPFLAWRLAAVPVIDRRFAALPPEKITAGVRHFWYDTALSAGRGALGALQEVAEPARILFGSDWPYAPDAMTRLTVAALAEPGAVAPGQLGAIERGNAAALFPRFTAHKQS
jgi:predicted TIM-barrel fold metal-dependent hydrolase